MSHPALGRARAAIDDEVAVFRGGEDLPWSIGEVRP
jgi:hypothetical protein